MEWKISITNSNSTLVKTISGSVNVTAPNATTGRVAEISVPWRGEQNDTASALPKGSYAYQVQALGPLGKTTNALTRRVSGSVAIGDQQLEIRNAIADPDSFDPSTGGNVRLGFDISTVDMGDAPEINWSADIVESGTNTTLHTFLPTTRPGTVTITSGTSLHVDLQWDGRDSTGAPSTGDFTWVVKARAKAAEGGNEVVTEATVPNSQMTVVEIKADNALPFLDENGVPVPDPTLYFSEAGNSNHPLLLAGNPASTGAQAWLKARNFVYYPSGGHAAYNRFSGQQFDFNTFIDQRRDPTEVVGFWGDCHDCACTAVAACAAVGVEQNLLAFLPGPFPPQPPRGEPEMFTNLLRPFAIKVASQYFISLRNPDFETFSFSEHMCTFFGGNVWDPIGEIKGHPGDIPALLTNLAVDVYFNAFIAADQSLFPIHPLIVTPSNWVTFGDYPDPRSSPPLRLKTITQ